MHESLGWSASEMNIVAFEGFWIDGGLTVFRDVKGLPLTGTAAEAALHKLICGTDANPKATTILEKIRTAADSRGKLKAALERECESNELLLETCQAALKEIQKTKKLDAAHGILQGAAPVCCLRLHQTGNTCKTLHHSLMARAIFPMRAGEEEERGKGEGGLLS